MKYSEDCKSQGLPAMNLPRRALLKTASSGLLLAPMSGWTGPDSDPGSLRFVVVKDGSSLPLFPPGTWLLADTAESEYEGPGLYLYPDWGQPRAYQVTRLAGTSDLAFHDPSSGQLLWTQSLSRDTRFAGKILAWTRETGEMPRLRLAALEVPRLPRA